MTFGTGETHSSLDIGIGLIDFTFSRIVAESSLTVSSEAAPDLMEADVPPYFDLLFPEETPIFRVKVNGNQHIYDLPVQIWLKSHAR